MNLAIFNYLNSFALQNEIFDIIVIFIADWLMWWIFFAVILLFLFKKITLEQFLKIIFYPVILWGISWVIKQLYFSPRPFLVLDNVKLLFEHGLNNSIPSGHTVIVSTLATTTYFYHKKIGIIFFVCAVLVGVARIIVGVHWPLDILASFLLAILGTFILNKLIDKFDFPFV